MDEATNQKARRKLSFLSSHHSQQPSFSQFYSQNHSINHLQLAINNLTQLIKESEQQLIDEQQSIINEQNQRLSCIENLQNDINHIQINIDSFSQEMEKLTIDTYDMFIRESEYALIRHNQVLRESIEYINQILRKRSIVNDSSFEQLKKDLMNQQEKLFLIRNQMDIDHNKLVTNMSILRECQDQKSQLEQMKTKKQIDLQNIQYKQDNTLQKQLHLQKLQISIDQQTRVRDDIQQLERFIQPRKELHQQQLTQQTEPIEELDLITNGLLDTVIEVDEDEIVEANESHSKHLNDGHNYSFNKLNEYRNKSDDDND